MLAEIEELVEVRPNDGYADAIWGFNSMPRHNDSNLDCSLYLYDSEKGAKAGNHSGASGFLVGYPSAWGREYPHFYAVTNHHAIYDKETGKAKNLCIRLNTAAGGIDTILTKEGCWLRSTIDDLAVCPLTKLNSEKYHASFVQVEQFITPDLIRDYNVGVGDEAYLVGRFIGMDGKQRNKPVVRNGHIAMMTGEEIFSEALPMPSKTQKEAFLVEVKTRSGFSGSPVFAYRIAYEVSNTEFPKQWVHPVQATEIIGPWLLGVHFLQIDDDKGLETGMAAVIPAWRLMVLLDNQELKDMREKRDKQLKKEAKQRHIGRLESADLPPLDKRGFENFMKKVSRKLPPAGESSPPDEEKIGT